MKAVLEQMQAMLEPQEVLPRSWFTQGCWEGGGVSVGVWEVLVCVWEVAGVGYGWGWRV